MQYSKEVGVSMEQTHQTNFHTNKTIFGNVKIPLDYEDADDFPLGYWLQQEREEYDDVDRSRSIFNAHRCNAVIIYDTR